MQAALFGVFVFPPPAPCAYVFTCAHWLGARLAAYAGIVLLIQRVHRHLLRVDISPHIGLVPIENWIELGNLVVGIEFFERQFFTRGRLFAALAGEPCVCAADGAVQRHDFADATTFAAQIHTLVKRVAAMFAHVVADSGFIRGHHAQLDAVARFGSGD